MEAYVRLRVRFRMLRRRLRILYARLTSLSRACVRSGIGLRLSLSAAWKWFVLGRLIGSGLRSFLKSLT